MTKVTNINYYLHCRIFTRMFVNLDHSPDKQKNNGETCIIEKLIDPRFMSWNLNYKLWLYWELGYWN
jgi:hypothetical protein